MAIDWVIGGGLVCGAVAGGAARFGRLCTMSAIEDALVGKDFRGIKAWALAVAVAIATTELLTLAGLVDASSSIYGGPRLHVLGVALGGLAFGLGMTLVGTCSFGLLVRAGGGDMRSGVAAVTVGIVAMATTAGFLSRLREPLLAYGMLDLGGTSKASFGGIATALGWPAGRTTAACLLSIALAAFALLDARVRRRPRLLTAAVAMGLAVTGGWWATGQAVATMALDRPESLSFVAPVGRLLLQFMADAFRNVGFGLAAAIGVVMASLAVAIWRQEIRWEAFDDPTEMRRHIAGAALMGIGGVLAQGCTIGQGLTAASTLALSAPLFLLFVAVGAKVGLVYLIEGHSLWRFGERP